MVNKTFVNKYDIRNDDMQDFLLRFEISTHMHLNRKEKRRIQISFYRDVNDFQQKYKMKENSFSILYCKQ